MYTSFGLFIYVLFAGPPSEPAGVYLDSATVTTTSVRVRWKASGDNLSPIKSYVVEGINQWEGFWKVLETSKSQTSFVLKLSLRIKSCSSS